MATCKAQSTCKAGCPKEHCSYGKPTVTDCEFLDNGLFRGYQVGVARTCEKCGDVLSTVVGLSCNISNLALNDVASIYYGQMLGR